MKTSAKIILLLIFSTLFTNCYRQVQFIDYETFKLNFEQTGEPLYIYSKFYNPNFFKVKITNVDIKLYVNNSYLGSVNQVENFTIPAGDTVITKMGLKINLGDIFANFGNLLQDSSELRMEGKITAKTLFGTKTVKINKTKILTR